MNNYSNDTNNFRKPQGGPRSNYRGSDKRGSDRRSSDRPRFNSRNSGPGQMYDAVCADCGNSCKVPFMPSSGKPVYCSNCFEKRGNGDTDSRRPSFSPNKRSFSNSAPRSASYSAPRSASRPQENYNKQFEIINSKLDKIFKLLNAQGSEVGEVKIVDPAKKTVKVSEVAEIKKVSSPVQKTTEAEVKSVFEKITPAKAEKKKEKS